MFRKLLLVLGVLFVLGFLLLMGLRLLFEPRWTKEAELAGTDGYVYSFMDYSFMQGQTMKLVRERNSQGRTTEEELGSTNGDSPRSWASVIRPKGAPDDDYGQLYLNPDGVILGIRYDNHCYFAYDTESGKFSGCDVIKSLSPFLLIEADTELHEPDILATILEAVKASDFYEKNPEWQQHYSLSGCPKKETLIKGLEHPNERVRELSKQLLEIQQKGLSSPSEIYNDIIDYAIEHIKSGTVKVRSSALRILGHFQIPYALKSIPVLEEAIRDRNREIACSAAYSLGKMGEEAFPVLTECLKSKNSHVRFYGLYGFRIAGPKASSQVEKITPLLSDRDSSVRQQAELALDNIGPTSKAVE